MRTLRLILLCLAPIALPAVAAIVDRVAITAGTKVITQSEIIRGIRLAAFQSGLPPDFSAASLREAAQRLIDQKLIEHEMDLGHYVRTADEETAQLLATYTTENFHSDPVALRLALAAVALTPEDLHSALAAQADLLSFLTLRFRPAVQVSDEDIQKYFHEHIETKAVANPVVFSEVRSGIEQILANQRADLDLEVWLKDQRSHTRINYLLKELQ